MFIATFTVTINITDKWLSLLSFIVQIQSYRLGGAMLLLLFSHFADLGEDTEINEGGTPVIKVVLSLPLTRLSIKSSFYLKKMR